MDAKDHCAAECTGGLKPVLDGRQPVQRAEFVKHEPCPQRAGSRQGHESGDAQAHPEREQCPVHRQIDIVRGDEQDRSGLVVTTDPVADRERLALVRQEAQRLRVGVEDGADRFRHASRLGRREWIGNRVRQEAMDALEVRGHQVLGQSEVGGRSALLEAHAHLDE